MSIKKSLQTYILLLAIIPVTVVTIIIYITASNKYDALNQQTVKTNSFNNEEGFIAQLDSQIIETESVANLNDIKSYLLDKINDSDINLRDASSYYDDVQQDLEDTSNNYNNSINYYLYDIDGYLVGSSDSSATGDWNEYMTTPVDSYKKSDVISNAAISNSPNSIDIITPVIVKEQTIGLLRANISITYFGSFVSESNGNYILDSNGEFLFDMDTLIDGDPDIVVAAQNALTNYSEENEDSRNGTLEVESSDKYTIYGFCVIPEYNWIYLVRQDGAAYKSLVSSLPVLLILLLICLLLIALNLSAHLAKKYTGPIYVLKDKMKEASTGTLDVSCDIDSEDEFGELSDMFNNMMSIISTNYNEIARTQSELEASKNALAENYNRIETLAYHDGLTGLYNRIAFLKYAYDLLHSSSNFDRHAIFFIDLDNFKNVNDTLGHDYGDILLKQVSNKLSSFIDDSDILARTGGDEFLILKNHVGTDAELATFARTLVDIASHPFLLEEETVFVSMSVGVSIFPQNGLSINELIKNADIAMYSAKTSGKNAYMFFNSTMEDEVNHRNELIDILRSAILNEEVYLVYQPQASVSTGEITGFEALMRLRSSLVGVISPEEFIPIAEECGLIDELGEWALITASKFNHQLTDLGYGPFTVSVNLSTSQIRSKTLMSTIESIPYRTGMPLEQLEIEITESVLMKNLEQNLDFINSIRNLGIKVSLDDFGTGYSSFNYLTRIPINTLKIDKSFIAGICDSPKDRYISSTIITLAHQLDISVIAEGVEDIEQLRILQEQCCDKLQGYFFSRPLSEQDFIQLLMDNI